MVVDNADDLQGTRKDSRCWLLLISINFTPKTSHSDLKKMVHYVFHESLFECDNDYL